MPVQALPPNALSYLPDKPPEVTGDAQWQHPLRPVFKACIEGPRPLSQYLAVTVELFVLPKETCQIDFQNSVLKLAGTYHNLLRGHSHEPEGED